MFGTGKCAAFVAERCRRIFGDGIEADISHADGVEGGGNVGHGAAEIRRTASGYDEGTASEAGEKGCVFGHAVFAGENGDRLMSRKIHTFLRGVCKI